MDRVARKENRLFCAWLLRPVSRRIFRVLPPIWQESHQVIPRFRIGEDELVRCDPYNRAVLAVEFKDFEG